ncbi:MAG TPA: cytidylate kinase-like family protein [Candidatus Fimivivens faecavium]|nr:cytidylate kinase-like family protein [Candidatus Fimivivens faecavium]
MENRMIITIGRQYGSGGREIGRRLAEKLGIPFYDKELIELAAKESGMAQEVFEQVDEKAGSSLLYALSTGSMAGGHFAPLNNLTFNDRLFLLQNQIIRDIAEKGPAVIVGRCANYILRERGGVVNVFVHAGLQERIARAVSEYGHPEKDAAGIVQKIDKSRANYYDHYTGEKWGVAKQYHLTLDSGVGLDNCVELIERYAEMSRKPVGER